MMLPAKGEFLSVAAAAAAIATVLSKDDLNYAVESLGGRNLIDECTAALREAAEAPLDPADSRIVAVVSGADIARTYGPVSAEAVGMLLNSDWSSVEVSPMRDSFEEIVANKAHALYGDPPEATPQWDGYPRRPDLDGYHVLTRFRELVRGPGGTVAVDLDGPLVEQLWRWNATAGTWMMGIDIPLQEFGRCYRYGGAAHGLC
jgi:hypothetical protein